MTSQFVEYADVERPGIKLVSAKQVQLFPTDTSIGVMLYALIHATSPSLIETSPQFQLVVTLGSTNQAEGITRLKIGPSQRDYPFTTTITYPDGTEQTVGLSLDQNSIFPLQEMEGYLYFQIPKTATQRIFASSLRLVG